MGAAPPPALIRVNPDEPETTEERPLERPRAYSLENHETMAVYERRYQAYGGRILPRWRRILTIPRFGLASALRTRRFAVSYFAALTPILGAALILYLPHNAALLEYTEFPRHLVDNLIEDLFGIFLRLEAGWAVPLFLMLHPAPIAQDLRSHALPLYLARPMSRSDYVLGHMLTVVIPLSLTTWVGGLVLFLLQALLSGGDWMHGHIRLGIGIVLSGWLFVALLATLGLAVSALVKSPTFTGAALLATVLVGSAVGDSVHVVLDASWGRFLDLFALVSLAFSFLLEAQSTGPVSGEAAIGALIFYILVSGGLLFLQLKPWGGKDG